MIRPVEVSVTNELHGPVPDAWFDQAAIVPATIFDAMEISCLMQANFGHHPAYAQLDTQVKADYLRANRYVELLATMQKSGTETFVVHTPGGLAAMILIRETEIDEVDRRLESLNGVRSGITPDRAVDIRRLHTALGFEGHGLGSRLMGVAERYALDRGISLLISDATGSAQGFFERHGYNGGLVQVARQNGSEGSIFRCFKQLS